MTQAAKYVSVLQPLRHLIVAALGASFALALYPVWKLDGRWFYVVVIAILLVAITLVCISFMSDFVLVVFMFAIPASGFTKWLFIDRYPDLVRDAAPVSGALNIGITDFLLIGMYLTWFVGVFVARVAPVPRLEKIDGLVFLLLFAYVASVWGAPNLSLGIFAIAHLVKHLLVYFFVSRNLQRHHLGWLLLAIAFALLLESVLGVFQNQTGMLRGLILDKGAGGDELNFQYTVPGIEGLDRATGTAYDSHSFGLYVCMLLPFSLVLLADKRQRTGARAIWALLLVAGIVALVVSYSRSAWISGGVSLALAAGVMAVKWRQRHVGTAMFAVASAGIVAAPWLLQKVFSRFMTAPGVLLRARFEQWSVAWRLWGEHPILGHGAGNYMVVLQEQNRDWVLELPVHNVFLFLGADTGIVGVLAFYTLIGAALWRFWKLVRDSAEPYRRYALAFAAGLIAYVIDGLTDPLFRESTVYMMFWFTIAASVALPRIASAPRGAAAA